MPPASEPSPASVSVQPAGGNLEVAVAGEWRLTAGPPSWDGSGAASPAAPVRLRMEGVEAWDSSLLLFFSDVEAWCRAHGVACDAVRAAPGFHIGEKQQQR